MRPYIHVNRSPNNLRKPSSDLKLIALTKVSERSKRIVITPPLAQRQGPPKAAPTENNSFNYVWANAQAFKPDLKKAKSDRREREKELREKRVQRGKTTGKRREGGCRILLRFSFSPLSFAQEVFLFGKQEAAIIRQIRYNHLRADDIRPYNTKPRRLWQNSEGAHCAPLQI